MKKLILMTSALTLVAGAAAANSSSSLSAQTSVTYGNWETGNAAATWEFETSLTGTLEYTAANGVSFGGEITATANSGDTAGTVQVEQGVIWASMNGVKVSFGVDEFDELAEDTDGATDGVNGVTSDETLGDVKVEASFGGVDVTYVAALSGVGASSVVSPALSWVGMVDYSGTGFSLGVLFDSTNYSEVSASVDAGGFTVGGTAGNDNSWDVYVKGSFGGVDAKVTFDDANTAGIELSGMAGSVDWSLSADSDNAVAASVDYSMGDLSFGIAYDNDDAGCAKGGGACAATTNGEDYGDEANLIVTIGYQVAPMLDLEVKFNDQSEYEASLTGSFDF